MVAQNASLAISLIFARLPVNVNPNFEKLGRARATSAKQHALTCTLASDFPHKYTSGDLIA